MPGGAVDEMLAGAAGGAFTATAAIDRLRVLTHPALLIVDEIRRFARARTVPPG